jgi:hypothetical protein
MKLATILAAALTLAACSAHNSLTPQPGITQGPVEQIAPDANNCQTVHDSIDYTKFKTNRTYVHIRAPKGYLALSAKVYNDMSNGMMVRGGYSWYKHTYVPGHDESYGGKPVLVNLGHHSKVVVMRAVAAPTWGYVRINIKWCTDK